MAVNVQVDKVKNEPLVVLIDDGKGHKRRITLDPNEVFEPGGSSDLGAFKSSLGSADQQQINALWDSYPGDKLALRSSALKLGGTLFAAATGSGGIDAVRSAAQESIEVYMTGTGVK